MIRQQVGIILERLGGEDKDAQVWVGKNYTKGHLRADLESVWDNITNAQNSHELYVSKAMYAYHSNRAYERALKKRKNRIQGLLKANHILRTALVNEIGEEAVRALLNPEYVHAKAMAGESAVTKRMERAEAKAPAVGGRA